MVQTVRVPVRKFARVGRPANRSDSSARTSGSLQVDLPEVGRCVADAAELALHLPRLPAVTGGHGGQRGDRVVEGPEPVVERAGAGQPVGRVAQPVDVLGEPPDQVDLRAADVVEREGPVEPGRGVVGERDAGEQPVETELPGVRDVGGEPELGAVIGVEGPSHARLARPGVELVEVVVAEPEPPPHRLGPGQVEDLRRRGPAARQVEQRRGDAEQRVGLSRRAVGEPDPQPVGGVAGAPHHVTEPEPGLDQGRVRLDVGTHHQDVTRLEGGVVVEEAQQHLTQHVDLAGDAVAGVHLDRAVADGQDPAVGPRQVGGEVALEPAEQGVGQRTRSAGSSSVAMAAVESARWSSRVSRPRLSSSGCRTALVAVVDGPVDRAAGPGQGLPQRRRGVGEPDVDVAFGRERIDQLDLGDRQPGVAEQRQAHRQVERLGVLAEQRHRGGVSVEG